MTTDVVLDNVEDVKMLVLDDEAVDRVTRLVGVDVMLVARLLLDSCDDPVLVELTTYCGGGKTVEDVEDVDMLACEVEFDTEVLSVDTGTDDDVKTVL